MNHSKVVTTKRMNTVINKEETTVYVQINEQLYFWNRAFETDKVLMLIAEAEKWIKTAEETK